ncbi:hypothetical protein KEM55_006381 [Ascosphaera atra]|nr:hypothetical protein KEM55_006381 [Ascosphaera atra]
MDWGEGQEQDEERIKAMKAVNPKFVPRSWILDEVIDRVQNKGDRDVLKLVMRMTLDPFAEEWGVDKEEEERLCGDPPRFERKIMCSCSS